MDFRPFVRPKSLAMEPNPLVVVAGALKPSFVNILGRRRSARKEEAGGELCPLCGKFDTPPGVK